MFNSKIYLAIIICIFTGQKVQGIDDPWMLFDRADHILHGTVIQVVEGERDRLYQIASQEGPSFDSSSWWLREPEGASTEGIGAQIGSRGAWLVAQAVGGEFPSADATVLPGGLLPILDPGDCKKLLALKTDPDSAQLSLQLIQSRNSVVRQIAIGWWRYNNSDLEVEQKTAIDWAFGGETHPAVQRAWLELYLQRDWIFSDSGLADLIPFAEDPTVSMLATEYLRDRGTARQKARLISSWPAADLKARKRLAYSYKQLELAEAGPWLLQGITASDSSLKFLCIDALAATGGADLAGTYSALLHSTSTEIQAAALRGLAQCQTAGSWQLLNETIDSLQPANPLRQLAISLKKHPWKVLQSRGIR